MKPITFFDTEIDPESGKILDIGAIKHDGETFHSNSVSGLIEFLRGSGYNCGHNVLNHDLRYLKNALREAGIDSSNVIDTLYLSPLLFPARPYHALVKDDKLLTEDVSNPLNDSIKARDLFFDEVSAFRQADGGLKRIFYSLLKDRPEFGAFFNYLGYKADGTGTDTEKIIREKFRAQVCSQADIKGMIAEYPVELAYCLALINTNNRYSITPPWVLRNYPDVERIMFLLKGNPCITGCGYCNEALNIYNGLKRFFGFDSFRTYEGEPLQEKAAKAAIENKSLLAVFPTGGGKSVTFQLPALMSGINVKGLTVVISPLQSLMKDQVDNLEKVGITEAVTINGLLDPIERAKSIERIENGSASILYISPESLRSRTIERLLLGRNVVRFVIDEAHCFSSWGQDFRVDYLYIGDFIKSLQEKKNLSEKIPVSCFTATAKPKVIEDIRNYFRDKLSLELELFTTHASRKNLRYKVIMKNSEEEKYNTLRDLIEAKNCPAIVYVSRTRKAYSLAQKLSDDGYSARPYHGKMDKHEKNRNQEDFIRGDVQIMVATSAFGMGVDKKDIGMVVHYEISDSLENYVQEAGRAGRDESITADCYVLFNEEDLNKHFILLNQTKINIKEIQQVWKAVKDITRFRSRVSQSALEIARKAGWDDSIAEIETRVRTAIAALEDAGYLKRGQNMPRIFANSILTRNAQEAIRKIEHSARFNEKEKEHATRIIKMLISSKSRKFSKDEEAEARVDYISDVLGIEKHDVIHIINLLREEKILAYMKDLTVYIKKRENLNHSLEIVKSFARIERFLLGVLEEEETTYYLKALNEQAELNGCADVTPNKIKTIINFWAIKNLVKRQISEHSRDHTVMIPMLKKQSFREKLEKRHELAQFIVEYLYGNIGNEPGGKKSDHEEIMVDFSIFELKEEFEKRATLFDTKTSIEELEDALFYLSRIEALKIEGGFLVLYNPMDIERVEQNTRKQYRAEHYRKLEEYYQNKVHQVHIVGEYARRMINNYRDALQFADDYFRLNYSSFLNKYFKGRQNEISRNITPAKFAQLFGTLSPTQLKIINDNKSQHIVVAAGPGSGKTRILVHKLASLLLMEDVKHEQLLMLTFSRAAATEFKKRLLELIGNAANFVEIKTYHSYCFDLLGRVGTLEKSADIINEAVRRIENNEVEPSRITKTVLVIDEAQDINAEEFGLISALMKHNENMRVIAVGDDDQNIYEFRGADSKYLELLIKEKKAATYELVENYRSKRSIVEFSNQFARRISKRLKSTPINAVQKETGRVRIIHYKSGNLIVPLVNDVLSEELAGTTCILTKTNDEALQVTGLLLKEGLPAKLIQSNDGFNLYNLLEVRFFLDRLRSSDKSPIISDSTWERAKRDLAERFASSPNLEAVINMIKDFELTNPASKYRSDLETFVRESRLEDFINKSTDTILVSTIHKAKGREFDNVYILLDQYSVHTDENIRLLYVAMTRAKNNLTIHYNNSFLDSIKTSGLKKIYDEKTYEPPDLMLMQLSHRDVWLDFFKTCQGSISRLNSGNELAVCDDCCANDKGRPFLRFSKLFREHMESLKQYNYYPRKASVKFIVYWQNNDQDREIKIILPELYFQRNPNQGDQGSGSSV